MRQLAVGVHDVGRGIAVVRSHPVLWKWLIAPAVITLLVLIAAVVGVARAIDPVVVRVATRLPDWLGSIAGPILHIVVAIILGIAALFLLTAVVGMVAGPFNELLSERVEAVLTGTPPPPFSLHEFARGAVLGLLHGLRRIAAALIGVAVVFALGFVPVIGTIAAVLVGGWLAATAASYDCYDAVLARRAMSYRDKLAYLARHRGRTLGLGLAVAGMLLVPGLNLVALGLGAAGATVASLALERGAS